MNIVGSRRYIRILSEAFVSELLFAEFGVARNKSGSWEVEGLLCQEPRQYSHSAAELTFSQHERLPERHNRRFPNLAVAEGRFQEEQEQGEVAPVTDNLKPQSLQA